MHKIHTLPAGPMENEKISDEVWVVFFYESRPMEESLPLARAGSIVIRGVDSTCGDGSWIGDGWITRAS
mgnify:CR=1 FL=1